MPEIGPNPLDYTFENDLFINPDYSEEIDLDKHRQ